MSAQFAQATINVLDSTLLVAGTTTLTVATKVYTFVSGSPVGDQIQIAATDPLTAANIAIRVSTDTATTLCLASAALDVVTLTANTAGTAGNSIVLSETAIPTALTVVAFSGGAGSTLVSKEDVKRYLKQLGDFAGTDYDTLLDTICPRVQDTIELYLGFTFDNAYTSATTKTVYGSGTPWLTLPPHELGSITLVTVEGGTGAITGYAEESDGSALYFTGYAPYSGGWGPTRYVVTANWGYGDWPDSVKEVAVELAANIFTESKTGHFSDVQGVNGAGGDVAVGYSKALTARQKLVLDMVKRKYRPLVIA